MGAQLRLRSHFPAALSDIFAIPYTYYALRFRHSLYAVTYSSSPFFFPAVLQVIEKFPHLVLSLLFLAPLVTASTLLMTCCIMQPHLHAGGTL